MTEPRGFPTPWLVVEKAESFCVEDAAGVAVAWTYCSDDEASRTATGAMTRDEAQRIAKAIAMIPEMRTIIRTLQDGLAEADTGES
ncbi:hypothetical protein ASF22_10195 [Methylobacterium sp. Leaf87]|uniref:hypothetical protein n=1 Tax=Methylobacterium sp. Leaf87 TaxID=1736243 RepID=UPI0006F3B215|nr:hypothetical protein [Methylobacterium sp. Leaf87]KQO56232.1 hypothetical protein ASF22_10195 [Methylobacterium sp. Leaf87]